MGWAKMSTDLWKFIKVRTDTPRAAIDVAKLQDAALAA
jgi:hypothetical protein